MSDKKRSIFSPSFCDSLFSPGSLSLSLSFPALFALLVLSLEFSVKTEIDYARYFQIFAAASISSEIFKYQKKAFPETKEGRYF